MVIYCENLLYNLLYNNCNGLNEAIKIIPLEDFSFCLFCYKVLSHLAKLWEKQENASLGLFSLPQVQEIEMSVYWFIAPGERNWCSKHTSEGLRGTCFGPRMQLGIPEALV